VALREPRVAPYLAVPARAEHLDEIARIERESFLVPWKREFFEAELSEPYRYSRVLVSQDGSIPLVGGYLFAVSLYDEFHVNKIATDPRLRNRGLGRALLEDAVARGHRGYSRGADLQHACPGVLRLVRLS
jgi:[ribosomal protein S18]-alanine N-acetyltransferase